MKILAKYITRQAVITLLLTICVCTFVLLLARILKQLSDMLVNQKVGLEVVGYFVLLMTPNVLSLSLPMAMLATAILIFGRMSADNEVTTMRASGMSLGQVVAPVILLGAVASVCCLYINADLAPWCRFEFKTLFVRLGSERPMALIEEGAYIKDFPGYVIYAGRKKGNIIEDVMIYSLDESNNVVSSMRAQKGIVSSKPEERKLLLDLYNVRGDFRDSKEPTNIHKIQRDATMQHYPIEMDLGRALRQARAARQLGDLGFKELLDRDTGFARARHLSRGGPDRGTSTGGRRGRLPGVYADRHTLGDQDEPPRDIGRDRIQYRASAGVLLCDDTGQHAEEPPRAVPGSDPLVAESLFRISRLVVALAVHAGLRRTGCGTSDISWRGNFSTLRA